MEFSKCGKCLQMTDDYYSNNSAVCKKCFICTKCLTLKSNQDFLIGFNVESKNNTCQECVYKEVLLMTNGHDEERYNYLEQLVNKCSESDIKILKDILSVKSLSNSTELQLETPPSYELGPSPSPKNVVKTNTTQIQSIYNQIQSIYIQIQSLTKQIQSSSIQLKSIYIQMQCLVVQVNGLLSQTKLLTGSLKHIHLQLESIHVQMQSTNIQIESLSVESDSIFIQVRCIYQQMESLILLMESYLGFESTSQTDLSEGDHIHSEVLTITTSEKTSDNKTFETPKFIFGTKQCIYCQKPYPNETGQEWKTSCNDCYIAQRAQVQIPLDKLKVMSVQELGELPLVWGKKYFNNKMVTVPLSYYQWMININVSHFDSNTHPHIYFYMKQIFPTSR